MSETEKPIVAAFDFDGTLTQGDSLLPFLIFAAGWPRFLAGMILLSPQILGYLIGLIRNDIAKQRVLDYFFGGLENRELQFVAAKFSAEKLPKLLRPEAVKRLEWHRQQGHTCVLISASLQDYLIPWARRNGFKHVIASSLAKDEHDRILGELEGGNCYGAVKAERLLELMGPREGFELYAYGDSRGDRELLATADHAFFKTMPLEQR